MTDQSGIFAQELQLWPDMIVFEDAFCNNLQSAGTPIKSLGFDVDTSRISFAGLDEHELIVCYGWCEIPKWDATPLALRYIDVFINSQFGFNPEQGSRPFWNKHFLDRECRIIIEGISPFSKGNHNAKTAASITRIASAVEMAFTRIVHHKRIWVKPPRTWMSKSCGLENGKNPSKEFIQEWAHATWDFEKIPPRWEHTITRGKRKGQTDVGINDVYDALGAAKYGMIEWTP